MANIMGLFGEHSAMWLPNDNEAQSTEAHACRFRQGTARFRLDFVPQFCISHGHMEGALSLWERGPSIHGFHSCMHTMHAHHQLCSLPLYKAYRGSSGTESLLRPSLVLAARHRRLRSHNAVAPQSEATTIG